MILLFSGGHDSTSLALQHLNNIDTLLHIQYVHPSKDQEYKATIAIYRQLKKIKPSLRLEVLFLTSINADNMSIGTGKSGSRYVPNRNAIFLSMAANLATTQGIKKIIYGAAPADQHEYFDCTPVFIDSMSRALQITIEAPLLKKECCNLPATISKTTVKKILNMVWSCYQARGQEPCGICNSCTQDRPVLY